MITLNIDIEEFAKKKISLLTVKIAKHIFAFAAVLVDKIKICLP